MADFLPALAVLFLFMFSGAVSWVLLPLLVLVRFLVGGVYSSEAWRRILWPVTPGWSRPDVSYSRESWGVTLANLLAITLLASLAAQLALDSRVRHSNCTCPHSWVAAFFLFVFVVESSMDKRNRMVEAARRWTEDPERVPEVRLWRVPGIAVLPLFLVFLTCREANIPWVYSVFYSATTWLFRLPHVGPVAKWLAMLAAAGLFWGCVRYLVLRCVTRFRPAG